MALTVYSIIYIPCLVKSDIDNYDNSYDHNDGDSDDDHGDDNNNDDGDDGDNDDDDDDRFTVIKC